MALFRYSLLLLVFITSCTLVRLKALETGGVCGNPGDSFSIDNMCKHFLRFSHLQCLLSKSFMDSVLPI